LAAHVLRGFWVNEVEQLGALFVAKAYQLRPQLREDGS
jgi:hypothetical protein